MRFVEGSRHFLFRHSALALLVFCSTPTTAATVVQDVVNFDIPQQRADISLTQFAEQADLTLIFAYDLARDKTANRLTGDYTPKKAIELLLYETGLKPTFSDEGFINIAADDESVAEGDEMKNRKTASLGAFLAAFFTAGVGAQEAVNTDEDEDKLEEVIVTGTNIRGNENAASPLIVFDREAIEKTGFSTIHQLVDSLPQNFGDGPAEDTYINLSGADVLSNRGLGSTINLRGLEAGSTLVLVNGRRQPAAGTKGSFVDISLIPIAAIDRVEILLDGASAIYGSDAIAGVINFVLRDNYDGAETSVRYGNVTEGNSEEIRISQTVGRSWDSGSALFSYEYFDKDALAASDRRYVSNNLTPLGGLDFRAPFGSPGNVVNPLTGERMAIPAGQDGTALTASDFTPGTENLGDTLEQTDVLPNQQRHNIFAALNHSFGSGLSVFANASFGQRDFNSRFSTGFNRVRVTPANPFFVDPFGGLSSVNVEYSLVNDTGARTISGNVDHYGGVAGLIVDFDNSWQTEISASYAREDTFSISDGAISNSTLNAAALDPDPATSLNVFGDGSVNNPATIESLKRDLLTDIRSDIRFVSAKADGAILQAPGGKVKLAVGADFRAEQFKTESPNENGVGNLDREVYAIFGEFNIPLIGENNSSSRLLEITLAARYEHYSDFGSSTDPKLGIAWKPVDGLLLRGTIGTSFKAPDLLQLNDSQNLEFQFDLPDSTSPAGFTPVNLLLGNNSALVAEESTMWTAGFKLTPQRWAGLKVDVTYFDIEFENRIAVATNDSLLTILPRAELFAPILTRNPDGTTTIDLRLKNLAATDVSGLDFSVGYDFDSSVGDFSLNLTGSHLFKFENRLLEGAPSVDTINTVRNPVDLRMRGSFGWHRDGVSAIAYLNYVGSYENLQFTPSERVDSWKTVDMQVSYDNADVGPSDRWWSNVRLSLSILNAFNEDPPLVNNGSAVLRNGMGYDPTNSNALGRFVAVQVTKDW